VLLPFYRFDFGLLLTLSFCIIHASCPFFHLSKSSLRCV